MGTGKPKIISPPKQKKLPGKHKIGQGNAEGGAGVHAGMRMMTLLLIKIKEKEKCRVEA